MNNMQHYSNLITSVEETSDDIHTQIGCVITAKDGHILSMGANKFTSGVTATAENVERPEKYDWIEHAERNAIYSAAKNGVRLENATMYLLDFPCVECSRAIAQSGITTLYTGLTKVLDEERYKFNKSRTILASAGVELIEGWRPE
jgi:dCMP deaminase